MVQVRQEMSPGADHELVERIKGGDSQAFDELVLRFGSKVLTICTYYLKDRHEAYDVSQEVFLKIHRGLPNFRGESKLSTWIHTIAINTCRNHVSFFRRLFSRQVELTEKLALRSSEPGPEEEVMSREREAFLKAEIHKLPAKYREIVILKDIQERSYEEIGEILEINQGTVKSRLHRAREALSERLMRTKAF